MPRVPILRIALLAAFAAATPARAQPGTLTVGETGELALTEADPAGEERGRVKVFRIHAAEGQRLIVTMRSTDFDAYLRLMQEVDGVTEELADDDDGAGDTNARIRFTVLRAGTYLLFAQSLAADGLGAFTLSLQESAAPGTVGPRPLAIGETLQGAL
ncbi:MAG TPA: hypothetical protein VNP72_05050, partial [Longimicrobium sp.]|nr:hypothetical protein [Longimicrobium sp.]